MQPLNSDGQRKRRVWFITGTSSGLGRSLVNVVLAQGDRVIVTARHLDHIRDFTERPDAADRVHTIKLDVTAPFAELREAAAEAIAKWGHVDILVNNAAGGFLGLTEEVGVEGFQKQFAVNFFGQLNVTNAFLPYMRARREGNIIFIGSRSSWRANVAMMGTYAASKAALTAAAEALSVEVAPLNIKVLNVLPGGIETDGWNKMTLLPTVPEALTPPTVAQEPVDGLGSNSGELESSKRDGPLEPNGGEEGDDGKHIPDYYELRTRQVKWMRSVKCEGDAGKCAQAIYNVIEATTGGRNLLERDGNKKKWPEGNLLILGADAEKNIRDKCEAVLRNLDEWKEVVRGVARDT